MKLLRLLPILLTLSLGAALAPVARAADADRPLSRSELALRDAEQKRFDAMVARDVDALGTSLADELTYTHSTGVLQNKAEFIRDIDTGKMQYKRVAVLEQHFRLHGFIGIINGVARLSVHMGEVDRDLNVRYTDIYVRRSGRWQLLAWQSTRLPD